MTVQTMTDAEMNAQMAAIVEEKQRRAELREYYRTQYKAMHIDTVRGMLDVLAEREDVLGELNVGELIEREVLETELARRAVQVV